MKSFLLICIILLGSLFYSNPAFTQVGMSADSMIKIENNKRAALIGTAYPLFNVSLNNKAYSSETLKGKTIFINFWFAACKPCMAEMEDLNKLFDTFKANKNFQFISFTFDDDSTIAVIKKKYHINYTIFSIPNAACYRLNLNSGFPTSFVIDPSGNIKYFSLLAKADNFVADIYPVIAKECAASSD